MNTHRWYLTLFNCQWQIENGPDTDQTSATNTDDNNPLSTANNIRAFLNWYPCSSAHSIAFNSYSPYLQQNPVSLVVKDGATAFVFRHETHDMSLEWFLPRKYTQQTQLSVATETLKIQFLIVQEHCSFLFFFFFNFMAWNDLNAHTVRL